MPNYSKALSDVRATMPNAPATANTLQSGLSRDLLTSLNSDLQKGLLTWQDVRAIRTRIGEKLADPQIIGDTGYTDLKRIYGGLSTDLQNAANTQGPAAANAFNQASALTQQGHDFIDNTLSKFVGISQSPEQAAAAALRGSANGGTTLQAIRDEMPPAADELAAYKLRNMGTAAAGKQNAAGTALSPGGFVTNAAKLSPEASDALFGADPALAQQVNDLTTVGDSLKGAERRVSGSSGGHGLLQTMLGSALGAGGAHELGGGLHHAILAGAAVPAGGWLASKAMTAPWIARAVAAPGMFSLPAAGLLAPGAYRGAYPAMSGLLGQ